MKKAQVSIYIIIGIVLLVITGTVIFVTLSNQQTGSAVPTWAAPVNSYVQDCIQQVSIKAFKKIGEHGGYIDFNDYAITGKNFNVNPQNPTESDIVSLSTQGTAPIAYWWYLSSPNACTNCNVESLAPSIEYIEGEVNRYITRELSSCLNDFDSFSQFTITQGTVSTQTSINNDDITILVNYPIDISSAGDQTRLEDFTIQLDLDFYDIYLLANLITDHEINQRFMEDILNHLIGVYSGRDSSKLPPIAWVDERDDIVTWNVDDVKNLLQNDILATHTPLIDVKNTRNARQIQAGSALQRGIYDALYLDIFPEPIDLEVDFIYNPAWSLYFDISPKSGNILKPSTVTTKDDLGLFDTINSNYYEFYYDVSYPVAIVIKDEKSLDQQGYTFMFALESNIRDNKDLYLWNRGNGTVGPADYSGITVSYPSTTTAATACTQSGQQWICPLNNQVYPSMLACGNACITKTSQMVSPQPTQTLFCEYEQRLSGDITIRAFDSNSRLPLSGASINFGCGNYRECTIDNTDASGRYIGKFPVCVGDGYLLLSKPGYVAKSVPHVSIQPGTSGNYDFYLDPLQDIEVEALYIPVSNMLRVKRDLMPQSGVSQFASVKGTLIALNNSISALESAVPTANQLSNQEAAVLNQEININLQLLKNAEVLINSSDERADIVSASLDLETAARAAWVMINNPSYYISSRFQGSFGVNDAALSTVLDYINIEKDNIQFLSDAQVASATDYNKFRTEAKPLGSSDKVTFSLVKLKEDVYEQNVPLNILTLEQGIQPTLSLVPGRYNTTLIYYDTSGITIPAQGSIPAVNYNPALLGGAVLDSANGAWQIAQTTGKVRFYILRMEDPQTTEDIASIDIDLLSNRYRAYIEPSFLP